MSSVMRSAYERPDAIQHFGNIEIGVKPGIVFNSFTTSPVAVKKKSTRASPRT